MEESDITEQKFDKNKQIVSLNTLFIVINICLYLIITAIDKDKETYRSIDSNINIYLQDDYYSNIKWLITILILLMLLLAFIYYKEIYFPNTGYLIISWLICSFVSISSTYMTRSKKNIKISTIDIVDIIRYIDIFLFLYIVYGFGRYTVETRKKRYLTIFIGILIPYIFYKIWVVTQISDDDIDNINSVYNNFKFHFRYGISLLLLTLIFISKLKGVRIYRVGEYIMQFMLFTYSILIIGREQLVFSRFQSVILPILLFLIYAILNYKEFSNSSINVKFVYILSFFITSFLLYIILNTNDKKIKTFITIFLVITFNILAIVYGNKGCQTISGIKLLERILKWTFLVSIIVLVLWKDIFQTSIGDKLIELKDRFSDDSYNTDTQKLEDRLNELPRNNQNSSERRNIRSEIDEIYEKNIRKDL